MWSPAKLFKEKIVSTIQNFTVTNSQATSEVPASPIAVSQATYFSNSSPDYEERKAISKEILQGLEKELIEIYVRVKDGLLEAMKKNHIPILDPYTDPEGLDTKLIQLKLNLENDNSYLTSNKLGEIYEKWTKFQNGGDAVKISKHEFIQKTVKAIVNKQLGHGELYKAVEKELGLKCEAPVLRELIEGIFNDQVKMVMQCGILISLHKLIIELKKLREYKSIQKDNKWVRKKERDEIYEIIYKINERRKYEVERYKKIRDLQIKSLQEWGEVDDLLIQVREKYRDFFSLQLELSQNAENSSGQESGNKNLNLTQRIGISYNEAKEKRMALDRAIQKYKEILQEMMKKEFSNLNNKNDLPFENIAESQLIDDWLGLYNMLINWHVNLVDLKIVLYVQKPDINREAQCFKESVEQRIESIDLGRFTMNLAEGVRNLFIQEILSQKKQWKSRIK